MLHTAFSQTKTVRTQRSSCCVARAATPAAPGTPYAPPSPSTTKDAQRIEAQAAFTASLERIVNAHKGNSDVVLREHHQVARLALENSSAARLQRQTHPNTVNMSDAASGASNAMLLSGGQLVPQEQQLPLSQLAFKALLRASLAAARLRHGFLTTPHLLLGLLSVNTPSLGPAAPAADAYATAEAAVVRLIDGPAAAAAQQQVLGSSRGLDVVMWAGQLSDPCKAVLAAAEQMRQQQGQPLLTSNHLLAALMQHTAANRHSSSSSNGNSSSRRDPTAQLLEELGLQHDQVLAAAAAGSSSSSSSNANETAAAAEDSVACEPLGFLHEEFYGSLCAALAEQQQGPSSRVGAGLQHSLNMMKPPCLN